MACALILRFLREGRLGSFSFFPVVAEQVFDPVEKRWVFSEKASVVHPSPDLTKAYTALFFSEHHYRW